MREVVALPSLVVLPDLGACAATSACFITASAAIESTPIFLYLSYCSGRIFLMTSSWVLNADLANSIWPDLMRPSMRPRSVFSITSLEGRRGFSSSAFVSTLGRSRGGTAFSGSFTLGTSNTGSKRLLARPKRPRGPEGRPEERSD
ncbi:hypothetical protein PMAYCL1PPCAC_24598 [Pristionchus mayeri]|uniref:Uncharacterized protein n=1 Tax=Pristionchus mayeri TaxID=1317129 RepID=A0AAN5I6P4_9BILA|nr:hypothetical protein PMAYCL1PPCAC_24598 [Pristionchus mayeri]